MLSRSNSQAADRLRRAKSTSSGHTTSSGHLRTPSSIDPFVIRQHAEAAAVEAYNRALHHEEPTLRPYRPVPPKLQRRRSQVTGRQEGGHFEDARLGRRRSTSMRRDGASLKPPAASQVYRAPFEIGTVSESCSEERIITRRRSVIPPGTHARQLEHEGVSLPPSTAPVRKTQSSYTDGSPAPRHTSILKGQSSQLQLSPPRYDATHGYGGKSTYVSDFGEPTEATIRSFTSHKPSIRETQTDEDIVAVARDRYLLDLPQKKVRPRKSMFLAAFQRRRETTMHSSNDAAYDTSLPPFNCADEPAVPPPRAAALPAIVPMQAVKSESKSRSFSNSLKGRIKNVFRKTSRAPARLPLQQVDAKHFHYAASEEAFHSLSEASGDRFIAPIRPTLAPDGRSTRGGSRLSTGWDAQVESRVTSWTNSTDVGTWSTRQEFENMPPADGHGGLQRSDSMRTLRKASSFFGRPIRNKLRRASRPELKSSEESEGLYSALQLRINPTTQAEVLDEADGCTARLYSTNASARSKLPSQQRMHTEITQHSAPTIRAVTPDHILLSRGVPSPVAEVQSPDASLPSAHAPAHNDTSSDNGTSISVLRRRPAVKAEPPSQDQIARRLERSKNRWQSPLNECLPMGPHPNRAAMIYENPYELRSLSQTRQQPTLDNGLPQHARVGDLIPPHRVDMLSPSVYSRASDGASPRPATPAEHAGLFVTITGREVRTYDISPKKTGAAGQRPVKASSEWQRWLSDEFSGFKDEGKDLTFTETRPTEAETANDAVAKSAFAITGRLASSSPAMDIPTSSSVAQRPRVSSRRSSFMNERYPMVDGSRSSSDRSIQSRHTSAHMAERSSSGEHATNDLRRGSADSQTQMKLTARQRVIAGRCTVGQLDLAARSRSALGYHKTKANPVPSATFEIGTLPLSQQPKTNSRPRSTFDLRANYKAGGNDASKPIEVRRKPIINHDHHDILEDTTIQDISAGPYASRHTPSLLANNRENTPPLEASCLPALSSSEWLAAGTSKARKSSEGRMPSRNWAASRHSPPKTGSGKESKGSPAQRMVTEFLEKRSRESTPAFV